MLQPHNIVSMLAIDHKLNYISNTTLIQNKFSYQMEKETEEMLDPLTQAAVHHNVVSPLPHEIYFSCLDS